MWSRQDTEVLAQIKAQEPPDSLLTLLIATRCQQLQIKAQFCSEISEYSG